MNKEIHKHVYVILCLAIIILPWIIVDHIDLMPGKINSYPWTAQKGQMFDLSNGK